MTVSTAHAPYFFNADDTADESPLVKTGSATGWIVVDVDSGDDVDESSAPVFFTLPPGTKLKAFRSGDTITVKRWVSGATDATDASYATFQGGSTDAENLIFTVAAGSVVTMYMVQP